MVICFLSTTHIYNDTRVLLKEAATLAAAGHDVVHIAPGNERRDFKEHGVRVIEYSRGKGLFERVRALWKLYRLARAEHPNALHCNEVESWVVGFLLKLSRESRFLVFDVHEHYPSRFDEPHVHPAVRIIGKPIFRPLVRILSILTDHFVFAKRSVAADYPDNVPCTFIFNYAQLEFIGRDISDVSNSIRKIFDGAPVLVHIGAFSRVRGWPQLLEALSLMKNRELRLFSIGTVAEGVESLMSEAARLGVADRVRVIERMDFAEMYDYLLCADIGCMVYQPGILNHVYAFPMKLYDYMLAGLAVIGPKFSIEVAPIIEKEKIGYAIDVSDPNLIADTLDSLCNDFEEARAMGVRAKQAVIREYNWESQAQKLLQLYRRE